ncbi:cyclin-dependent protein kinase inhibitor SMR10-like [Macadamia integrifolia]|uniref:cyclin-dependent protein kinase inhibitor SMR10-like n=1 Tax=Macadamia integrifolia TaxID=60698 RepID=UPI001C52D7AA|nr:cyclin-dependent protein kinase inhibitor SMR10-like [Macadamia integrifolia]
MIDQFNFFLTSTSSLEFSSDGGRCLIASTSPQQDYDHHPQVDEEAAQEEKKKECESGNVSSSVSDDQDIEEEVNDIKMRSGEEEARTRTVGGELEVVEEDDDGFRTPTTLDHRIPAVNIKQCPPAPRKPNSNPKRKASSSSFTTRRQLFPLDLSQEIESLFPPALLADLGRKIKKVRGGDHCHTK